MRSALASLEALEPHLVPALVTNVASPHAQTLTRVWKQELDEIRDNVYLIVDPAALVDVSYFLLFIWRSFVYFQFYF